MSEAPAEEKVVSKDNPLSTASDQDALHQLGYFYLVGDINEKKCLELAEALLRTSLILKKEGTLDPTLNLDISSDGGLLDAAFMLGGTIIRIRRMGIAVNIHVLHEVCSAASLILQYGTHRSADQDSAVMLHDVSYGAWGNTDDHRRRGDVVNMHRRKYAQVLASRNTAGLKSAQWWIDNYMGRDDNYLSAQEAFEMGLLDTVLPLPLMPTPSSLPNPPSPLPPSTSVSCQTSSESSPLLPA